MSSARGSAMMAETKAPGRVLCAFLVYGGVFAIVTAVSNISRGRESAHWSPATATIASSDLRTEVTGGEAGTTRYWPEVSYRYQANGRRYVGTRIRFGPVGGSESQALEIGRAHV